MSEGIEDWIHLFFIWALGGGELHPLSRE